MNAPTPIDTLVAAAGEAPQGLERILVENRPRAQTLRWYFETIGVDFNEAIRRVNQLDTLGLHR